MPCPSRAYPRFHSGNMLEPQSKWLKYHRKSCISWASLEVLQEYWGKWWNLVTSWSKKKYWNIYHELSSLYGENAGTSWSVKRLKWLYCNHGYWDNLWHLVIKKAIDISWASMVLFGKSDGNSWSKKNTIEIYHELLWWGKWLHYQAPGKAFTTINHPSHI